MAMKLAAKSIGIAAAEWLGPRLPGPRSRRWLFHGFVPWLMDPAILSMGAVSRPLKRIPVRVPCDPYVYVHRNGYWCGVFFEEEVESYLLRELRPGDTVIDVGVNVGHVALPAAFLVSPGGQVLAFEPNPQLAELVERFADEQGLTVRMRSVALSDVAGIFPLRMDPGHSGGATLRETSDPAFTRTIDCMAEIGDAVIAGLTGRVLLKVDVEGFELHAIRGLQATLTQVDHAILEVSPQWLHRAGVRALFGLMAEAGLNAFQLRQDGSVGHALDPDTVTSQVNVVFRRR